MSMLDVTCKLNFIRSKAGLLRLAMNGASVDGGLSESQADEMAFVALQLWEEIGDLEKMLEQVSYTDKAGLHNEQEGDQHGRL